MKRKWNIMLQWEKSTSTMEPRAFAKREMKLLANDKKQIRITINHTNPMETNMRKCWYFVVDFQQMEKKIQLFGYHDAFTLNWFYCMKQVFDGKLYAYWNIYDAPVAVPFVIFVQFFLFHIEFQVEARRIEEKGEVYTYSFSFSFSFSMGSELMQHKKLHKFKLKKIKR